MNKKEQLKRLICALYRQDEPEDYTDECMEDMLDNIDFEVLLQAVAHSAKTVYAYCRHGAKLRHDAGTACGADPGKQGRVLAADARTAYRNGGF